jgi:hypothetical protein
VTRRTATVPGEALRAAYERAEQHRQEAAEVERRTYQARQDAYGAHEVARDEANTAHRACLARSLGLVEVPV